MHRQAFAQIVRQFFEVPSVRLWQDQLEDFLPPRRNHLLAHTTNRQHLAGEGQLAGHGHAFFRRLVAGQRQQGTCHGDASARAVFGRSPFRYMQVDERFVEEARVTAKLLEVGADIAVGNFGRLLHHVTQLASQLEATVEGVDAGRLDR